MSVSVLFHNILDEKLLNMIGFGAQPLEASYTNNDYETIYMSVEPLEGQEYTYEIVDPRVQFDPELYDLKLHQRIEISNPHFLFGDNGIVCKDSVLGIAFRWMSKESAQRKVYPVKELFPENGSSQVINIDITIPKGSLRGRVTFQIVLYLVSAGKASKHIVPGTILGILDSRQIMFDGDSSLFPIVEVDEPLKPLWWVICDFIDPMVDEFNENNVAVVLNKGHKNFRNLKIEKGLSSSPLLIEIIASALQIIIEKVKASGEWERIMNNESEPGSIGEAVYYFLTTFGWDPSSPEALAKTIREDFDSRFK